MTADTLSGINWGIALGFAVGFIVGAFVAWRRAEARSARTET